MRKLQDEAIIRADDEAAEGSDQMENSEPEIKVAPLRHTNISLSMLEQGAVKC